MFPCNEQPQGRVEPFRCSSGSCSVPASLGGGPRADSSALALLENDGGASLVAGLYVPLFLVIVIGSMLENLCVEFVAQL